MTTPAARRWRERHDDNLVELTADQWDRYVTGTRVLYFLNGAEVRKARLALGLEMREVAARLGLSKSYIKNLESGRRASVSPATLAALAELLG